MSSFLAVKELIFHVLLLVVEQEVFQTFATKHYEDVNLRELVFDAQTVKLVKEACPIARAQSAKQVICTFNVRYACVVCVLGGAFRAPCTHRQTLSDRQPSSWVGSYCMNQTFIEIRFCI